VIIIPAIGSMTLFDRFRIIVKIPEFQSDGERETCDVYLEVFSDVRIVRFLENFIAASCSKSCLFVSFVEYLNKYSTDKVYKKVVYRITYLLKNVHIRPPFLWSLRSGEPAANGRLCDRAVSPDQPKRPERRGIRVIPISATPPPAISCLIPC